MQCNQITLNCSAYVVQCAVYRTVCVFLCHAWLLVTINFRIFLLLLSYYFVELQWMAVKRSEIRWLAVEIGWIFMVLSHWKHYGHGTIIVAHSVRGQSAVKICFWMEKEFFLIRNEFSFIGKNFFFIRKEFFLLRKNFFSGEWNFSSLERNFFRNWSNGSQLLFKFIDNGSRMDFR